MGTPLYFYTPVYTEGSATRPGTDSGEGPEPAVIPNGMNVLKYDSDLAQFVIKVPYGTSRRDGWIPKYPEQVLEDYPGLVGVV